MSMEFWALMFLILSTVASIIFNIRNEILKRKGVIETSVLGYTKYLENKNQPKVDYELPQYALIKNISTNVMKKLACTFSFELNNVIEYKHKSKLEFLNPKEEVSISADYESFFKKIKHELIEREFNEGKQKTIIKYPKKDLSFRLHILIKANNFFQQKDVYEITWRTYGEGEDLETYLKTSFYSINKRDGLVIRKCGEKIE